MEWIVKRVALDISTKNIGLAIFDSEDKIECFTRYNLEKILSPYARALPSLPIRVKTMAGIIVNDWPTHVKQLIVEITPIPSWVGRVILLYTGAILGSYLSVLQTVPEIKFVKPREWQKIIIPDALKHKKNRGKIKEMSINTAFAEHPEWKELAIKHFGKKIDDIADAINIGRVYDQIQGERISKEWQNYH